MLRNVVLIEKQIFDNNTFKIPHTTCTLSLHIQSHKTVLENNAGISGHPKGATPGQPRGLEGDLKQTHAPHAGHKIERLRFYQNTPRDIPTGFACLAAHLKTG